MNESIIGYLLLVVGVSTLTSLVGMLHRIRGLTLLFGFSALLFGGGGILLAGETAWPPLSILFGLVPFLVGRALIVFALRLPGTASTLPSDGRNDEK